MGLWTVLVIVVPLALWIGLAPLAMAVVAPAHVKVDLNRRPVQHLEGGIVRQVLVRDGQVVKEGEPLVVIGDVGVDADRNRLSYRLAVERTTLERLDAEQRRAGKLVFSESLQAEARKRSAPAGCDGQGIGPVLGAPAFAEQRAGADEAAAPARAAGDRRAGGAGHQGAGIAGAAASRPRGQSRPGARGLRLDRAHQPDGSLGGRLHRPSWRSAAPNSRAATGG